MLRPCRHRDKLKPIEGRHRHERIALGKEREQLVAAHMRIDMLACPRKPFTPRHIDLTARPKPPIEVGRLAKARCAAPPIVPQGQRAQKEGTERDVPQIRVRCQSPAMPHGFERRARPCHAPGIRTLRQGPAMSHKSAHGATPQQCPGNLCAAPCPANPL